MENDLLNNFLTVKEALPYFKITSVQTFYTWIKTGKLPEKLIQKIGNNTYIRKNILKSFLLGHVGVSHTA